MPWSPGPETSYLSDLDRFLDGVILDQLGLLLATGPEQPLRQYSGRHEDFFRECFGDGKTHFTG